MNILVTGANGQLGNEMRIVSQNTTDQYLFTDVNQVEGVETTYLDITDMDAIRHMVSEHHIDAIVNCAAWTNVDACETDEKACSPRGEAQCRCTRESRYRNEGNRRSAHTDLHRLCLRQRTIQCALRTPAEGNAYWRIRNHQTAWRTENHDKRLPVCHYTHSMALL